MALYLRCTELNHMLTNILSFILNLRAKIEPKELILEKIRIRLQLRVKKCI